jgi:ferredoxin-type protein NapH
MKRFGIQNIRAAVIIAIAAVIMFGYIVNLDVGNISALGIGVVAAICPLGILEVGLANLTLAPRAIIALVLAVAFAAVFGKVFCAWICPTPLIQRWFPGYKRKEEELKQEAAEASSNAQALQAEAIEVAKGPDESHAITPIDDESKTSLCGKHKNIKLDSRHLVLGGSLLSAALFGFPVFCLACPVGLTFASLLLLYRLFGFGETTWTIIVFPIILVLELVVFRKWCSKICPLGALVSLFSGLNRFFRPKIDEEKCLVNKGVSCTVCAKACNRESIDPRRPTTSPGAMSDCSKCRDCAAACPAKAISFPFLTKSKERDKNA